ncbi:BsuPI-related putative proteinase inhibitor [Halorubrum sp. HHNYT27]|uniref:BsuPI-related putative proteinase inhibitor n=1 Tax=Halorubrum sp. HHNYT27 TaxID=3402275 RepID=UPI003EBF335B
MLDATLTAVDGAAGVDLTLTVTNEGDDPLTLRFRTGQRADFVAYAAEDAGSERDSESPDADADPVWRHGDGRLFTQALSSETLEPGASTTVEGTWEEPPQGPFLIVGSLTAEAHDASATARVTVD